VGVLFKGLSRQPLYFYREPCGDSCMLNCLVCGFMGTEVGIKIADNTNPNVLHHPNLADNV